MAQGSASALHQALVDHLRAIGVLTSPAVEAAFRAVPRHLFLPSVPVEEAYRDDAIPTKMAGGRAISSSSQPAIMAIMLEQLAAEPGHRVLEIGAGTGYNAALLAHLVGPNGRVVSVDIDDDIVAAAQAHFAAAGIENVRLVRADGGDGYAPDAPYDRIILTVAAWDITPAWQAQLVPGGRLVLPLQVGNGPQNAIAFDKATLAHQPLFVSRSVQECGFMSLRGAFAGPEVFTQVGTQPGLTVVSPADIPVTGDRLFDWLTSGGERTATGLQLTEAEAFGSLALWLDLHSAQMASLMIEEAPPPPGGWPCLFALGAKSSTCLTYLLLTTEGLAVLDGRHHRAIDAGKRARKTADESVPFELRVIGYGPQGQPATQTLLQLLHRWNQAGRPASARLRVRVFSPDYPYALAPGETLVSKRWTKLVVDWAG